MCKYRKHYEVFNFKMVFIHCARKCEKKINSCVSYCSTTKNLVEKLKERDCLENLVVDDKIVL
jgi:hypothetical protein